MQPGILSIPFSEVTVSEEEASRYRSGFSLSVALAAFWNRFMPRGKGAVPRLIGRLTQRYPQCISTKHGALLAVHPGSMEVYAHMLNNKRTWNPHIFETCRRCLQPGQVFYDVGANIGFISIELEKAFAGNISVIAFEPQPDLSRTMVISAKLNSFDKVHVFEVMLGDKEGTADLFIGSHTIHASAVPREDGSRRIERQVLTLDRLVSEKHLPPPDVIKLDIEGGELSALRGAQALLQNFQPHLIFESDENMQRFGYHRQDLLDLLSSQADYDFFFIPPDSPTLVPLTAENAQSDYSDILARSRRKHSVHPVV